MKTPKAPTPPPKAPSGARRLTVRSVPHPFAATAHANHPHTQLVVEAINAMGMTGDPAEAHYQKILDGLRHQADVVAHSVRLYHATPETQYLDRWALVQLHNDLKDPASLHFLDEVIASPIPPERATKPATGRSTVGREVVIRTTAVEAVRRLAAHGDASALAVLLKHVHHDNYSIKRAAIQGYLETGGPDARARLEKLLPAEDLPILDIRRIDARHIPRVQVSGQKPSADLNQAPPPHGGASRK
jgi:hypothetical protein